MPRRPEIGNVQLYPQRPLKTSDRNGYVLKFYCPIREKRIRKNCGTRDRREARRILRECRERLLNGEYVASGGAITQQQCQTAQQVAVVLTAPVDDEGLSWQDCYDRYHDHRKTRVRPKSLKNALSRLSISQRVLEARRIESGQPESGSIGEYVTLEQLEYLQDRLLDGEECRYDLRSPTTVNSMLSAVMAFIRFCHVRGWIDAVPPLSKLPVDEVMKGRPITEEEFQQMLDAVPGIVGGRAASSWETTLKILWESAFRVSDVMNFSWDDDRKIHPRWPSRRDQHPTLIIPSTQKNKKAQEIPMLPGLQDILEQVPKSKRTGWVADPRPIEYQLQTKRKWFRPPGKELARLVEIYNNSAIGRACGVSETAVRKWLAEEGIVRERSPYGDLPKSEIAVLRHGSETKDWNVARHNCERLTKERVGRIISDIGEAAKIVVIQADPTTGRRLKYASAHDLRRSCAQRLINAGVSAETLKVLLRHEDFMTTQKYYAATRSAQTAADDIHNKLVKSPAENQQAPQLSQAEMEKLRALLNLV